MIDDGTITIGTEVSTKGIKKDLTDLQKELEKYDKEAQELLSQKATLEVDTSQLDVLQEKLKEAKKLAAEMEAQMELRTNAEGYQYEVYPEGYEDQLRLISGIENEIAEIQNKYNETKPKVDEINQALDINKQAQEDIKKEYKEQLDILQQIYSQEAAEKAHNEQIRERQRQVDTLTSKFKRVGLALLGVGSVYGIVRKLAREYMNEHEEQAAIFKQAWANIVEFITPYVEKVVNLLLKMLGYLNVFIKTLTGGKLDLTKKMNKNEKSVKATSKAVKELNNQIASFDDATKLSDNRSLDVGVGDTDLDKLDELNKFDLNPKWVEKLEWLANKIKENWPTIKQMALEIGVIFATAKVGSWLLNIGNLLGYGGAAATGAGGSGLVGLAVGLLAVSAALGILATAKTWNDVIENYKKFRQELENLGTPGKKSVEVEQKMSGIANDTNATPEQVGQAFKFEKENIGQATNKLKGHAVAIKNFKSVGGALITGYEAIKGAVDGSTTSIDLERKAMKDNAEEIFNYIDNTNKLIDNKELSKDEIKNYIEWLRNERIELRNVRDEMPKNSTQYQIMTGVLDKMKDTINKYDTATSEANKSWLRFSQNLGTNSTQIKNDIQSMTDKIIDWNNTPVQQKKFSITTDSASINEIVNATSYATSVIGQNIAKSFGTAMTSLKFQMAFTQAANNVSMGIQRVFGLAKGGIINMPGPGVSLGGSVIGGERAPEGIIPFTDEQVMETLGEAIGRHVTINAEIINSMNGRVISRELQKINNENTFMMNR